MTFEGSCKCKRWQIELSLDLPLSTLNPRVCDCQYCQANPSQIISHPNMLVVFTGDGISTKQNGDQLATFYHCNDCNELLAVGCNIDGRLRGAVNSDLLDDVNQLGTPVPIQPRLLSPKEKLERWNKLWGELSGL